VFDFIYSFAVNSFLSWWKKGKLSGIVSGKSLKLSLHDRLPRRTFGGLSVRLWFRVKLIEEIIVLKLEDNEL